MNDKNLKRVIKGACATGMGAVSAGSLYILSQIAPRPGPFVGLIPFLIGAAACTGVGAAMLGKQAVLGEDQNLDEIPQPEER